MAKLVTRLARSKTRLVKARARILTTICLNPQHAFLCANFRHHDYLTMSHAKANVSWDGGSAGEMGNFIPITGGRIIWMLDKRTDIKYLSIGNIIPGQINKDRLTKRNFWFYWKS